MLSCVMLVHSRTRALHPAPSGSHICTSIREAAALPWLPNNQPHTPSPPFSPCAAEGIDDGQGLLVRTVMGAGLGPKLAEHHVWRPGGLLHGAQLRLAGQPGAPLGGLVEAAKTEEVATAKKAAPAGRRAEIRDEDGLPLAAWVQA